MQPIRSALTAELTNAMQISDFGMYLFADLWHDVRIWIEYVIFLAFWQHLPRHCMNAHLMHTRTEYIPT